MTPSRLIPRLLLHRLPPPTTRTIPTPTPIHPLQNHFAHHYSTTNPIPRPRIAQSSFWSPIIPKFLRNRRSKDPNSNSEKPKEWNPASFYIIIFILIGSQAIRMLALKHEYAAYMRTTNAKIATLKEVIERVQRGEAVDVAKMLGTGDQAKEREWEDGEFS